MQTAGGAIPAAGTHSAPAGPMSPLRQRGGLLQAVTIYFRWENQIMNTYCWCSEIRRSPPGMVLKPCKYWEKLPTVSTGELAGFQPSTVGPKIAPPVRCRILSSRKVGPFLVGFFVTGAQNVTRFSGGFWHSFFWKKKHDQNLGKENIHNFRTKTEF